MVTVNFKSVARARKYVPYASSTRQAFANTHVGRTVRKVGRHQYLRLYNKVTKQYTDIYMGDIVAHWSD